MKENILIATAFDLIILNLFTPGSHHTVNLKKVKKTCYSQMLENYILFAQ
jgi:hypothetical protein